MSGGRRRGWLLAAAALFAGASLWGCAQPADGPARTLPQEGSVSMEGREEDLSLDSEETEREALEIFSDREEAAEELPHRTAGGGVCGKPPPGGRDDEQ